MTKEKYLRMATFVAVGYWIISLFVGSRPAFPLMPYGAAAIGIVALGSGAAYVGGRVERFKKVAFAILTACCLFYGAFIAAEVFAHFASEDGYYVRPLLTLPLIAFGWYGAWKWFFAWNVKV